MIDEMMNQDIIPQSRKMHTSYALSISRSWYSVYTFSNLLKHEQVFESMMNVFIMHVLIIHLLSLSHILYKSFIHWKHKYRWNSRLKFNI